MKIGTRVKATTTIKDFHEKGEKGTVFKFEIPNSDGSPANVQWDRGFTEWCSLEEIEAVDAKKPQPITIQFIPRTRKGVKYFQIKITKQGKVFNHQYNSKQGAKKSFESLVNDIKNDNFIVK